MNESVKMRLWVLSVILLGIVIGSGSAVLAFESTASASTFTNGPWRTDLTAGSQEADIYTRNRVAVHGLLALNPSEAIYFTARTDDGGQPLNSDNAYRIVGKAPDARWWSIAVYGVDDFLVDNELDRYSYTCNSVAYDSEGKFTIYVSKTQKSGNWLPLGNSKGFDLCLRLFNPGESVRKNPATAELPHIVREMGE
jgi:hypothetical protein